MCSRRRNAVAATLLQQEYKLQDYRLPTKHKESKMFRFQFTEALVLLCIFLFLITAGQSAVSQMLDPANLHIEGF